MTIDPAALPHLDPDLVPVLQALDIRIARFETLPVPPANRPPVWTIVPPIVFTQGVAGTFSIAPFVTDPDNDPLTITKNTTPLPAGVTYNPTTKSFAYDGVGVVALTSGNFLIADDGRP